MLSFGEKKRKIADASFINVLIKSKKVKNYIKSSKNNKHVVVGFGLIVVGW